jgi:site-specific recombinase XerD
MVVDLIYRLQNLYGLRISEVLGVKTVHLIGANKILIKGLKGSGDRIIIIDFMSELRGLYCHYNGFVFFGINRFFVYREYKKIGIGLQFENSKNAAVTHAPRHLFIRELKSGGVSTEALQGQLQHKSIKSTKHYEGKK